MDFKSFFKNRNVIIIIVSLIVIGVCIALSRVAQLFMPIAVILSGLLCLFFAYLSFVAYKNQTNDLNNSEELTQPEQKKQKRKIRYIKSYGIGQVIVFIIFAITFLVMGINMF